MKPLLPVLVAASLVTALLAIRPGYSDDAEPAVKAAAAAAQVEAEQKTAKRKKPRGRLPNYYGKVGVSDEQRETIYAIQAEYRPQIEELQKKIARLESERDERVFNVLTETQKALLKQLIEEAEKRREELRKKKKAAAAAEKAAAATSN